MIPFACRASTAIVQTPHSRMVAVTFKPQDISLNKLQSISVPFIHWISRFFDTAPYEDLLSTGVVIAHKKACKHLPDVFYKRIPAASRRFLYAYVSVLQVLRPIHYRYFHSAPVTLDRQQAGPAD